MQQLSKNEFGLVHKLFNKDYPNLPMVLGVIERLIPGQIIVDNKNHPTMCMIMSGAPYCFIKGRVDEERFIACLKLLEQKPIVKLVFDPSPAFDLLKYGFLTTPRRQYSYKNTNKLPVHENTSRYIIKKIDNEKLFDTCLWKSVVVDMFGSFNNYLKHGMGFIFWDDDNNMNASEVHGVPSNEYIEIGTITNEKYRGQQLSTILSNHIIRYAIKKNLKPMWTCDEENFISWKVAERQGFDELTRYTFYTWSK